MNPVLARRATFGRAFQEPAKIRKVGKLFSNLWVTDGSSRVKSEDLAVRINLKVQTGVDAEWVRERKARRAKSGRIFGNGLGQVDIGPLFTPSLVKRQKSWARNPRSRSFLNLVCA